MDYQKRNNNYQVNSPSEVTSLLENLMSINNNERIVAEETLQGIMNRKNPADFDIFFQSLNDNINDQLRILTLIIIKNYILKINPADFNELTLYEQYFNNRKSDIVNIILTLKNNSGNSILSQGAIILESLIKLFPVTMNLDLILEYIFIYYSNNKSQNNTQNTFQALFILYRLLKGIEQLKLKANSTYGLFSYLNHQ